MSRPATPIAVAIVRDGTRVLVGQRPEHVPLAGYWEFPGGKVESGESPEQAAVRECHEETGLDVRVIRLLERREHTYDHGSVALHFFLCELSGAADIPQAPYRWIDGEQLGSLRFPEANRAVLELLRSEV